MYTGAAQSLDNATGVWHHFAISYNSSTDKLRIVQNFNRVLLDTTREITLNPTSFKFTNSNFSPGAQLDDIRYWDTALSDSQIYERALYNIAATDSLKSSLKGYWKFDEGSGTTVADSSGTGNTVSLIGAVNFVNQDMTAFDIGSKQAKLICPFNGTTTCFDDKNPSTATGAISYSTNSALQFDGNNDYVTSPAITIGNELTVSLWINRKAVNHVNSGVIWRTDFGYLEWYTNSSIVFWFNDPTGDRQINFGSVSSNVWHHVVITSSGTEHKGYIDGVLVDTNTSSHTIVDSSSVFELDRTAGSAKLITASMDEVIIYNKVLSQDQVNVLYGAGNPSPVQPDAYTQLLWHFDENGDDPRNSGKALDASGNGKHGTIYGAKYSNNSSVSNNTYASHQGVLIQEGTTNLITNPSFEHSTFNTNWTNGYFTYATASATFTASMAKRNSAAPFAAGLMSQSKYDTTRSDALVFQPSTNIGKNFRVNYDFNQGTIVFWITPEWNGNDGKTHYFLLEPAYGNIRLYKSNTSNLVASFGNSSASVDVSSWTAGSTYSVIIRWDTKGTLNDTNYVSVSVNDSSTFGGVNSSDLTSFIVSADMNIASYDAASNYNYGANSLIEGLTIYRRPLFDGQYGINVGNGDELTQIYNSGTGKDPTLVTGSWDVVFALPTNSSTGTITTGTGNAWSHPHSSNLLGGTNGKNGFMMDGTYTNDGFSGITSPTVSALATNQKIFAGGYAITANQWDGMYKDISVTPGQDVVIRGIVHSDGTAQPQLILYDQTNNAEIGSLYGTTTATKSNPDILLFTGEAPAGCNTIRVKIGNAAAPTATLYVHQIEVYENLVNNPSLERGAGDPWIPGGWNNQFNQAGNLSQETSIIHTGTSALRINAGDYLNNSSIHLSLASAIGKFIGMGGWFNGTNAGQLLWGYKTLSDGVAQYSTSAYWFSAPSGGIWQHAKYVGRNKVSSVGFNIYYNDDLVNTKYSDDLYAVTLSDVTLTVTPANQANSSETAGLRVDGGDLLSQPITGLSVSNGVIKFKFNPRQSFENVSNFQDIAGAPMIFGTNTVNGNYLNLYKATSTALRIIGSFNGNTIYANWLNPVLTPGVTYFIEISYNQFGNLQLKVDGNVVASVPMNGNGFSDVPTIAYFGKAGGNNQPYDGNFTSFVTSSVTENNSASYTKYGAKSIKLQGFDWNDQYITSAVLPSNNAYTVSAYVYDATSGNAGGSVDANIAQIASHSAGVTSTYTDQGGGWWRLTHTTPTIPSGTYNFGIDVKPGKTIYVDGIQVEQKGYFTNYADGSLATGYSWTGTAHASTSTRDAGVLRYPSGNLNPSKGTISFWVKRDFILRPDRTCDEERFFSYYQTSGNISLYCGSDNRLRFVVSNGSNVQGGITVDQTNFGLAKWHHIVGTWDIAGSVTIYLDTIQGSQNPSPPALGGTFTSMNIGATNMGANQPNSITSDLKIYDQVLSDVDIIQLYNQGLQTHSYGVENDDRYNAAGTYTSPVMDLGANGAWGSTPLSFTTALNGGTANYFTRTSLDNNIWSSWQAVTGSAIASDPRRYFQWKADLTSPDQATTPVVSTVAIAYVEDTSAPTNPEATALGFSTAATPSANLVSGNWYNFSTPKFSFEAGDDPAAMGQSSSGIDGYYLVLTKTANLTPDQNTEDPCYQWLESDNRVYQTGCTLTNGTYYLRLQAKDNSGNTADPVTVFTYRYDGTAPTSPSSVSSTTVGYTSQNAFTFFWPTATDAGGSQIRGYEYKTGAVNGTFSTWTFTSETQAASITAYQEGQNFFFVRTVDVAGNVSAETSNASVGISPFYYNSSAPTAPQNVVITPSTTATAAAAENVFSVSWDKPASYSGEIAKYYYCVNCTPSAGTMTETTPTQTVNQTLINLGLATQQGKNTFYILAEDNNLSELGHGNRNFEGYATVDFYASTIAPSAPGGLTISDVSDRETEEWRLTLAWKQGTTGGTPSLYNIYRQCHGAAEFTKVGSTTSTAYTDADLEQGKACSYYIQAVDSAGSTSLASNTVTRAPEGKFATPPTAGGSPSITLGPSTAVIQWTTSRAAFGSVEYGLTNSFGSSTSESAAVTNHRVKLQGLIPGTRYHYRVQSLDDSSLVGYERAAAYSTAFTFTTLSRPEISDITISDINLDSVLVSWKTVSLASTVIDYGESTEYGQSLIVTTSASSSSHMAKLTSLKHSTTYHFRVKGITSDDTGIYSEDNTFTTQIFPKVTAMVFDTDQGASGTSIVVAWSTNIPTTGTVEYQTVQVDPDYQAKFDKNLTNASVLQTLNQAELMELPVNPRGDSKQLYSGKLEIRHVMRLSGLEDATMYIITLRGRDTNGLEAVSEPWRYVTGADTRPPRIENLMVETPLTGIGSEAKGQLIVSWDTDEPASGQILWGRGTGSEYPQASEKESALGTSHVIVLRDLDPTTSFHFKLQVTDAAGNATESEDTVIVTPAAPQAALDLIFKNLQDIFGFLKL